MSSLGATAPGSQRERILESARTLFASRGFDEVTMADVADAAGVARATVFNQFGSKHGLVEAITGDVLAYYHAMLDAALADVEHSTPTLIRALFAQMGAGIEGYLTFHRAVFREFAKLQVGLDEGGAAQHARDASIARVVELFERGQARGDLSRAHRALDLALAYEAVVNGTITHWLYDDQTEALRHRMQRAADIFLGAVAVGPTASISDTLPQLAPELEPAAPVARRRPQGGTDGAPSRSSPKSGRGRRARARRARA